MINKNELNKAKMYKVYALPNGGSTTDYEQYKEAWFWHGLIRNVVKCHVAGANKYCCGRL